MCFTVLSRMPSVMPLPLVLVPGPAGALQLAVQEDWPLDSGSTHGTVWLLRAFPDGGWWYLSKLKGEYSTEAQTLEVKDVTPQINC